MSIGQHADNESLLLTKRVFDVTPDHISVLGTDYRYRRVNPAYEKAHGLSLTKIVGKHVSDLLGEKIFQQQVKPKLDRCLAGETVTYEDWFEFASIGARYMMVTYTPSFLDDGGVDGIVVVSRDSTALKLAELRGKRLEHALDYALEGVGLHDEQGNFTYINQAEAALYGYKPHELLGKSWKIQYDTEQIHQIEKEVFPLLQKDGKWKGLLNGRKKTGELFDVEVSLTRLVSENGFPSGLICMCRDVTKQKKTEEALRQSEEKFRRFFNTIQDGYLLADLDGDVKSVNPAAAQLLGYQEKELLEKNLPRDIYVDPKAREELKKRLVSQKKVTNYEILFKRKNGTTLVADCNVQIIENAQDGSIEIEGLFRDRTEQKQSENDLRESEERLRASEEFTNSIIENIPNMVFVKDAKHLRFVKVNKAGESLIGYSRKDLIGKNDYDFFPKKEADCFTAHDRKVLESGKLLDIAEEPIHTRLNGTRTLHTKKIPLYDKNGFPEFLLGISEDITKQRQSDAMLKKWATIFQNTQWGVAVSLGDSSDFELVNEAFARMHGYSVKELVGKPIEQVYAPEFRSRLPQCIEKVHEQGYLSFEAMHIRKDGSTFPALVTISAIKDSIGKVLYRVANVIDIFDRKEAEEALRTSESTLKSFFDSSPFMMGISEVDGNHIRPISYNLAAANFFNLKEDQKNTEFVNEMGIPHDQIQTWMTAVRESQETMNPVKFEYQHSHPQRSRWVSLTVAYLEFNLSENCRFAYVIEDITDRKRMEDELRRYADGLEAEVTRRTQRIYELKQRRVQVEKLAALAQIAAGVAHEINNPLASISQSMLLLKRAISPQHSNFHYVGKIDECVERIAHIVKQLYQLYRPEPKSTEPIDLMTVVRAAVDIMMPSASKKKVHIQKELPERPLLAKISRVDLIQVLCNLVQNAIDVSPPNESIVVKVVEEPESTAFLVQDHGPGIDSTIHAHIFEPFFTTKQGSPEGGMGLGLAVSRSLVKSMGGNLDYISNPEGGTTFRAVFSRE